MNQKNKAFIGEGLGIMIYHALSYLAAQLNQFFRQSYGAGEDIVSLSGPVDSNGAAAPNTANKLLIFLVNLEKDPLPFPQRLPHSADLARTHLSTAPLYLNLYVMVAANFSGPGYAEGIKLVSSAIGYFQRNPVLDRQSHPGLETRIEKLLLEMKNLDSSELSNLWSLQGSRYLPSVLYKVRMVAFDTEDIVGRVTTVQAPQSGAAQ